MSEELEREFERVQKEAESIVAHVERMGASRLELPAMGENCSVWKITVEFVGGVKC